jgi:hypothetical protein
VGGRSFGRELALKLSQSGLRTVRRFLKNVAMSIQVNVDLGKTNGTPRYDPEVIFSVLNARPRRRLLFALALRSPQSAADLMHVGKADGRCNGNYSYVDSTSKHLNVLVAAGLVVREEDMQEGRRWLYSLAPGLDITVEGDRKVFDFGFIAARISANGD